MQFAELSLVFRVAPDSGDAPVSGFRMIPHGVAGSIFIAMAGGGKRRPRLYPAGAELWGTKHYRCEESAYKELDGQAILGRRLKMR